VREVGGELQALEIADAAFGRNEERFVQGSHGEACLAEQSTESSTVSVSQDCRIALPPRHERQFHSVKSRAGDEAQGRVDRQILHPVCAETEPDLRRGAAQRRRNGPGQRHRRREQH
jgi:hypothetical protein